MSSSKQQCVMIDGDDLIFPIGAVQRGMHT